MMSSPQKRALIPARKDRWDWSGRGRRPAGTYRGARRNAGRQRKCTALRVARKLRWLKVMGGRA